MKINDLKFASAEPVMKTLNLKGNDYQIGIRQIAFGDMEKIGASTAALIEHAIVFDDGQRLTRDQVERLDVQTAAALLALVNEVNAQKN